MTGAGSAAEAAASFDEEVGRTDVWVFDRTDPSFARLAADGPVSTDERERARRLRFESGRQFFLARRATVRRVLGLYLGRAPQDVRLVTLPGGKPTFLPSVADTRRLSFSSSQSGDRFCLAVGVAPSLGVDVETIRPVPRSSGIAERWFSVEEAAVVESGRVPGVDTAEADPSHAFLQLWTAKEALAKRHAAGLRLLRTGAGALDVLSELERGTLRLLDMPAGSIGALASTSVIEGVRMFVGLTPTA